MALDFNGANYTVHGDVLDLTDNFTISFWIIHDVLPSGNNVYMGKAHPAADSGWIVFYKTDVSPKQIRLQFGDGIAWAAMSVHWDVTWAAGEEHHCVITRAGVTAIMYEDGVINTNKTNLFTTAADVADSSQSFDIGRQSTGSNYIQGKMWDVRVYDGTVLTAAQAKIMYESRGMDNITTNLAGRFLLNEGPDGSTASGAGSIIDISGNGYNGTPTANPTYSAQASRSFK